MRSLFAVLSSLDKSRFPIDTENRVFEVAHFEKDDDKNFHIAFITSIAPNSLILGTVTLFITLRVRV